MVAVGLTVLGRSGDVPAEQAAAAAKARSLETWLDRLSRDDLLGLVREQVRDDRGLRRRAKQRRLRTATGQAAAVSPADAIVAAHASATSDPVILTSDPSDLAALAEHAARPITITPA